MKPESLSERFTTSQAGERLNIVPATIKNWANEFMNYLSPSATPEPGRTRMFTFEDLRVFTTIARLRRSKTHIADIHHILQSGERDELPPAAGKSLAPYPPAMAALKREISDLNGELERYRVENEQQRGSLRTFEKLLEQKEQRIRDLYREMALLELRLREATYKRPRKSENASSASSSESEGGGGGIEATKVFSQE